MKLPVIRAFSAGLALFFSKPIEFIKALWIPALIMMAAMIFIMPRYLEILTSLAALDPESDPQEVLAAMGPMAKYMGLLYLAMAVVYPMMAAGVLKYIIRGNRLHLPFYLQFGGDEFNILLSIILLFIMLGISYVAGALALLVLTAVTAALAPTIAAIIAPMGFLAFGCAIAWFLLRMSLTLPATIGVRKVGLAESWRLTKGNAWRLFFYWGLWMVVFLIIMLVYFSIGAAGYFAAFMEVITSAEQGADAMQEVQARMIEIQRDMWNPAKPGFWPFAIATYLYTIVYSALWNIAGGVAYRYLAGDQQTELA